MNDEAFNGALARIILRYFFGALAAGSPELGRQLASDPDLVMTVSVGIVAVAGVGAYVVEKFYKIAKKRGWKL